MDDETKSASFEPIYLAEKYSSLIRPALRLLLEWKLVDERKAWAKKAVNLLMTKLKKKSGVIEDLERALYCPDIPSRCVTLTCGSGYRIQVLGKKDFPHVIYCRVWRWPELQTRGELVSLDICEYAYSAGRSEICINPYHYERVVKFELPPVFVPRHSHSATEHSRLPVQKLSELKMPNNVSYSPNEFNAGSGGDNDTQAQAQFEPGKSVSSEISSTCSPLECNSQSQPPLSDLATNHTNKPAEVIPIDYIESMYWASINCFQFKYRVGKVFHCKPNTILLDNCGKSRRNGNHLCLGQVTRLHCIEEIENLKRQIGRGVKLSYINGRVRIECLSHSAIFAQSKAHNRLHGLHPGTCCKILPGHPMEVFNIHAFADLLSQSVNHGFEAVSSLKKMCTIRILFAEEGGAEYHGRNVTSTPCWVEVHLLGPSQWLDRVLVQMVSSYNAISSVS